jgi:hypothetical protein
MTTKRTFAHANGMRMFILVAGLAAGSGLVYAQASASKNSEPQKAHPMTSMMVDEGQARAMMAQRQQMMALRAS